MGPTVRGSTIMRFIFSSQSRPHLRVRRKVMNGPYATYRRGRVLIGVLLAVLLGGLIGVAAYSAGVSHGVALQVPTAVPGTYPYPHYEHPWGFGLFFPL